MTNTPAPLKSSAPRSSFRDMLYIRPQLRSYVTCNRIVVAIFVRATSYTGERRSFDQLETSNTIPLLNASADMPRQTHTCVDRAVVPNTWTLRLPFLFRLYENFAPSRLPRKRYKLYFCHFCALLCEILLSPSILRWEKFFLNSCRESLADSWINVKRLKNFSEKNLIRIRMGFVFLAFIRSEFTNAFDIIRRTCTCSGVFFLSLSLALSPSFSFPFLFFCEPCYAMRRSKIEEGFNDDDHDEKWHTTRSRNWTRTRRLIS